MSNGTNFYVWDVYIGLSTAHCVSYSKDSETRTLRPCSPGKPLDPVELAESFQVCLLHVLREKT